MTQPLETPAEADLVAWADGRLEPADAAPVEAWLAAHPERVAELRHWQRQNEAMSALFPPVGDAVPARLDPHRIAMGARTPWLKLAAAAIVLLAIGGGLGWAGRTAIEPSAQARLIDHALIAHNLYVKEKRHAVEVAALERDHMVSWLSNRIERQIDSPDLSAEGFALVGGRLLPSDGEVPTGPAALLMYENAAAERLTIYVTGPLPDRAHAYEFVERDGVAAWYWADATITCTVAGALPAEELHAVARKVFQQLSLRSDAA